jgi:hypothetical protein
MNIYVKIENIKRKVRNTMKSIVVASLLFLLMSCLPMNAMKKNIQGINDQEKTLLQELSIGGTYKHYKGKKYRVLGVARHSEDLQLYVHYEALYDAGEYGQFWMRPLAMFLEEIEIDGHMMPRFKKMN